MSIIRKALRFIQNEAPTNTNTQLKSHTEELFGSIDFPITGIRIPRGEISISGHVFHVQGYDCDVKIQIDDDVVERAGWGLPRFDVYQKCMLEQAYDSGFVLRCRLPGFPGEQHELKVIVTCNGQDIVLDPVTFSSGKLRKGDTYIPQLIFPATRPGLYKRGGEDCLSLLVESAGLKRGHTVLEIGSGMGRAAVPLSNFLNADVNYYGIDVLREVVVYCTENITRRYPNFLFRHIDVENGMYNPKGASKAEGIELPLLSASADMVFLWSVFTHMRPGDIASYLKEISRLLKPGATLVASYFLMTAERLSNDCEISTLTFNNRVDDFWTTKVDQPEQAIALSPESLGEMHADSGLSIQNIIYAGGRGVVGNQDVVFATK